MNTVEQVRAAIDFASQCEPPPGTEMHVMWAWHMESLVARLTELEPINEYTVRSLH